MTRYKDRTEDFSDAIRIAAISLDCDEAKVAGILASMVLRGSQKRSDFTHAAIKTIESIRELKQFILKHKKDYLGINRATEQEKDSIEHEVGVFVKMCKEQIDMLKNTVSAKSKDAKRMILNAWKDCHPDNMAHRHGVVLCLSEMLHGVICEFDHLRTIRLEDAISRNIPRRKFVGATFSNFNHSTKSVSLGVNGVDTSKASCKLQQHFVDEEERALQAELANLLDAAQETEARMLEVSTLSHLMSTHVLQQAQQIEKLYEQALEASRNMKMGNKVLSEVIRKNRGSRTFLLLFLFVLTFSVLFLDWYS